MESVKAPVEVTTRRVIPVPKRNVVGKAWDEVRTMPTVPFLILVIVIFSAVFGPYLTPLNPLEQNLMDSLTPTFWETGGMRVHLLGTDNLGRDSFTRLVYGARISLLVSLAAIGLSGAVGTLLGMISGYVGGRTDNVIMRATDAMLSMPAILIAIAIVGAIGSSLTNVIIVIAITAWAGYARIVRGEALRIKESDFVRLAVVAGCGRVKILFVHIFPNLINTLIVLSTLSVANMIIYESSLSFLGLGVPLGTPSWGSMLADGRQYLTSAWWLATFPGLAIMFTCLGANMMGDWLRDRLDPRRQRQ